jgi:hypothetical protein
LVIDQQPADAKVGHQDVAARHLMVDVGERPAEHAGEQVFDDVLGRLLGCPGVPATFGPALRSSCHEGWPRRLGA